MHAYTEFVTDAMDARRWNAADLARASGLSKQVLSSILTDSRPMLQQRPSDATVDGLARAFSVHRDVVLTAVGRAMGLPMGEPREALDARSLSNAELLAILADRLP